MTTALRVQLLFLALCGSVLAAAACGARSDLLVDEPLERDAGHAEDVVQVVDAGRDAPVPVSCEEAGVTYIYLVTQEHDLYHFYPPDLSVVKNGLIACPEQGGDPFSMAVDRAGKAYVLFTEGEVFRIDPAEVSCVPIGFNSGQHGFPPMFGMGFSADTLDMKETLYVAGDDSVPGDDSPSVLARIDTKTFELTPVGPFSQPIGMVELTGTGDGKLYAFGVDPFSAVQHLAEIDKTTGAVLSDVPLSLSPGIDAWAFAFWGGDFYFFIATQDQPGTTDVFKYHPDDESLTRVQTIDHTVVGAGESTCAPP
jgi:hypothetical protein